MYVESSSDVHKMGNFVFFRVYHYEFSTTRTNPHPVCEHGSNSLNRKSKPKRLLTLKSGIGHRAFIFGVAPQGAHSSRFDGGAPAHTLGFLRLIQGVCTGQPKME